MSLNAIIYLFVYNSGADLGTFFRLPFAVLKSKLWCSALSGYSFSRRENIREVVVPCLTCKISLKHVLMGCVRGLHNAIASPLVMYSFI